MYYLKGKFSMISETTLPTVVDRAMVVSYPNSVGDPGRYPLRDQREYFSKFAGGSSYFFELALNNVLNGDLLEYVNKCTTLYDLYSEQCGDIFESVYTPKVEDNTITPHQYSLENREYNRRIFDLYRYAKTSVAPLAITEEITLIKKIATNPEFDCASFIIR